MVLNTVLLLLFVLVAAVSWPARFGGRTTMVLVTGTSMQPIYHTGDLVVAWKGRPVRVGDIAVYRVPKGEDGAGHQVVHRIVARDGAYWVFRGDNRTTNDSWHPTDRDIVGKVVFHAPRVGRLWWFVFSPVGFAAITGILVARFFWPAEVRRPFDERLLFEPSPASEVEQSAEAGLEDHL